MKSYRVANDSLTNSRLDQIGLSQKLCVFIIPYMALGLDIFLLTINLN